MVSYLCRSEGAIDFHASDSILDNIDRFAPGLDLLNSGRLSQLKNINADLLKKSLF